MELLFATELLNSIAAKTAFVKREREITGRNLAISLIHSLATGKLEGIADLQRGFNEVTGKDIQYTPAFIKRYLALAAQQISQTGEISTRKVAMCLKIHFAGLMTMLMLRRKTKDALKKLVFFLSRNAKRAHPKRDRTLGSRNCGLEPIFIINWGGLRTNL